MNAKRNKSADPLGVERTMLANERTMLAYVRTALAFMIAGASLLRFFAERPYEIGGAVGILLGGVTFVVGMLRYIQVRRRLDRAEGGAWRGGDDDE